MALKLFKRKGSKNWFLRGTIRGRSVYESTGTSEKSAAESIRIQREKEILDRTIFGPKATATFLEAAVSYMEAGGERRFLRPLIEHFGTTPLAAIDQTAIDRAARKLFAHLKASSLGRQCYTPISAVLHHAAARGLCDVREIDRPRVSNGPVRWLSPEEAEKLIAACSPHLRPLVIFLFATGARLSEALYLDWKQVDLAKARVQFIKTKSGYPRGMPLHPRAVAALANLPHREGEVFRRPDGKPYARKKDSGGQIKTAFKGACRRAGITGFTPHGCRHTFASWLYGETRDIAALMELGGWKSEKMVLRYSHINPSHREATISALPWPTEVAKDFRRPGSRGRAVASTDVVEIF